MVVEILVNIGSSDHLMPDNTKPLPKPVFTKCQLNL